MELTGKRTKLANTLCTFFNYIIVNKRSRTTYKSVQCPSSLPITYGTIILEYVTEGSAGEYILKKDLQKYKYMYIRTKAALTQTEKLENKSKTTEISKATFV